MKLVFFTLFLVSLLLSSSFLAEAYKAAAPTPTPAVPGSCDAKCKVRCSEAGYFQRCYDYCYICCNKCSKCVPSGPRANKAECPCYRDMLNSKGKPKCP